MMQPGERMWYSPSHTWVRAEADGDLTVGITEYAQVELGELQYVGLPRVGSAVTKDAPFGEVESVKTASELFAPCSGTVVAVNARVIETPSTINSDPYGAGWIIRVHSSDIGELDTLQSRSTYEAHAAEQTH